jgi:hypothetical protein
MGTKSHTVACHWDAEAQVWYVAETDVPGLATEAATLEQMEWKLLRMVPELVELNESRGRPGDVPFELIARKHELASCA